MGERTILVCDVCGKPASQTVTIRVGRRNLVKDFCSTHLSQLTAGARAPRRGRRKSIVSGAAGPSASSARRGRPTKRAAARKTVSKKSGARRRGRPRKTSQTAS